MLQLRDHNVTKCSSAQKGGKYIEFVGA